MRGDKALPLPFVLGLGESIDQRIAPAGLLETARNVYPKKEGRLAKRDGYARGPIISRGVNEVVDLALVGVDKVTEHRGALPHELIAASSISGQASRPSAGAPLMARPEAVAHYIPCGTVGDRFAVVGQTTRTNERDVELIATVALNASLNGFDLIVYPVAGGYWTATLRDSETGALIRTYSGGPDQYDIRVWSWPGTNYLCFGWVATADSKIYFHRIDTSASPFDLVAATQLGTMVVSASGAADNQTWDVTPLNTSNEFTIHVAVLARTGDTGCLQIIDRGLGTPLTGSLPNKSERTCAIGHLDNTIFCFTGTLTSPTDSMHVQWAVVTAAAPVFGTTGSLLLGSFATVPPLVAVGGIRSGGGVKAIAALTWVPPAKPEVDSETVVYVQTSLGIETALTVPGLRLASTFFSDDVCPLLWLEYNYAASLQRGRFLMAFRPPRQAGTFGAVGSVVSRVGFGVSRGATLYALVRPALGADGRFWGVWSEVVDGPNASPATTQLGMVRYDTEIAPRDRANFASLAGTNISGGAQSTYDGKRVCEIGWWFWPPTPSLISYNSTPPHGIPAGTYAYVAVYEETDALGNVHQSPPSLPLVVTHSGADDVVIRVQSPWLTARTDVRIALYRTTESGFLFHRILEVEAGAAGVDKDLTDNLTDAQILAKEALRASGGEQEEMAPPCGVATAVHGNRLFVGSGDELWFTKEYVSGFAHGFSAANVVKVPAEVRGLASTGDALLILGEEDCWVLWGVGPDRLGTGYYDPPQWVDAVGCPRALGGARSVAQVTPGVMWRGKAGIYLLGRGESIPRVVSRDVEDLLATYPIVSAIVDDVVSECVRVQLNASDSVSSIGTQVVYWYGMPSPMWTEYRPGVATPIAFGMHSAAMVGGAHRYSSAYWSATAGVDQSGVYTQTAGRDNDNVGTGESEVRSFIKTKPLYPFGRESLGRVRSVAIDGWKPAANATEFSVLAEVDGVSGSPHTISLGALVVNEWSVDYETRVQLGTSFAFTIPDVGNGTPSSGLEFAGLTLYGEPVAQKRAHKTTMRF